MTYFNSWSIEWYKEFEIEDFDSFWSIINVYSLLSYEWWVTP